MPPTVIVTETLDQAPAQWLAERTQVVWCSREQPEQFRQQLAEADGLVIRTYTQVNDELLRQAPKLKVVGRAGVGLENVDLKACKKRGVVVVYTPEANTQAVAEYVIALMLDALRPRDVLSEPISAEKFHALRKHHVGHQLDQLTLGILGFGRIGTRVGRAAHGIGMKLLVNDLLPEAELRKKVDYPFEFIDKPTLYSQSDVLSLHVDPRPENHQLINAEVFGQLKPTCLFINAARGMLVDHVALIDWARSVAQTEDIAGTGVRAILDVHDPEPIPTDSPLYGLPNVWLLPHIAARTRTGLDNMSWVVRDVVAVLEGREPQYPAI